MLNLDIPLIRPRSEGNELKYIEQALNSRRTAGNGPFTAKCQAWIKRRLPAERVLLTHSGTGALELAARLCNLAPGDEVIMPSFTFPSSANAVVLCGATPVFVDCRTGNMNINETLIEAAITDKTKAIMVVHYAGFACEMDTIMTIAEKHGLYVIEDAAQAFLSEYKGRQLGTIGHFGAFSFHETKNVISGEGGALVVNAKEAFERAEILLEKGTNRSQFMRGEIDKYSWVDIGSSYLPSEITAAFLLAQLEKSEEFTEKRRAVWATYDEELAPLEIQGYLKRPVISKFANGNGHIYYIILSSAELRDALMAKLKYQGIQTAFHFIPLHNSVAGRKYGRSSGDLSVTCDYSERLLRLPVWPDLPEPKRVTDAISRFFERA